MLGAAGPALRPAGVYVHTPLRHHLQVMIEFQNEFASEGGKLHDAVKEVMQR